MSAEALRSLRDVRGVMGSFVVDASGAVVMADVPAVFDGVTLSQAGTRIARLCEALASAEAVSDCVLDFGEHALFLHCFDTRILCVLAPPSTSAASVRMGSRLTARQLQREVEIDDAVVITEDSVVAETLASERLPAPQQPSPRSARRPRFFRGRRLD